VLRKRLEKTDNTATKERTRCKIIIDRLKARNRNLQQRNEELERQVKIAEEQRLSQWEKEQQKQQPAQLPSSRSKKVHFASTAIDEKALVKRAIVRDDNNNSNSNINNSNNRDSVGSNAIEIERVNQRQQQHSESDEDTQGNPAEVIIPGEKSYFVVEPHDGGDYYDDDEVEDEYEVSDEEEAPVEFPSSRVESVHMMRNDNNNGNDNDNDNDNDNGDNNRMMYSTATTTATSPPFSSSPSRSLKKHHPGTTREELREGSVIVHYPNGDTKQVRLFLSCFSWCFDTCIYVWKGIVSYVSLSFQTFVDGHVVYHYQAEEPLVGGFFFVFDVLGDRLASFDCSVCVAFDSAMRVRIPTAWRCYTSAKER